MWSQQKVFKNVNLFKLLVITQIVKKLMETSYGSVISDTFKLLGKKLQFLEKILSGKNLILLICKDFSKIKI